jgi:hypothetical protein
MNPNHPHDHDSHVPAEHTGQPYFPAVEWEAFQLQDKRAAAVIVGLMASIFMTGLLLYLGVCFWVAG